MKVEVWDVVDKGESVKLHAGLNFFFFFPASIFLLKIVKGSGEILGFYGSCLVH